MTRNTVSLIESLESRMLLSSTLSALPVGSHASPAVATITAPTVTGLNLTATAGTPFYGQVGFYASPVLDPPLQYGASINWGDGTTTNATLTYGSNGKKFGLFMDGLHTYAKAGTYTVNVKLSTHPITPTFTLPTTVIEHILHKMVVAPLPINTSNGVTLHELPAKAFTAVLGTFTDVAPATNLTATISWGDGKTSKGTITRTGTAGIKVIAFKVTGGHTYTMAGKYAIHIVITKPSPLAGAAAAVVATIESTAIVGLPIAVG